MVLETNMNEIVAAINEMNKAKKKSSATTTGSLSVRASETLRAGFRH